jgi:hypothetical protein
MITHQELLNVLSYSPETGVFTWRKSTSTRKIVGSVVGSVHRMGYLETSVLNHRFLLHRLAWFYVYGEMPKGVIDHINGDKQDNRIANLRDVCQVVNGLNRTSLNKNNRSGVRGVVFHKKSNKYMAKVQEKYLGIYADIKDAKNAIEHYLKSSA